MKTYLVDMNDDEQALEVEQAYWDLFTSELQCFEHATTPTMDYLRDPKMSTFICKDGDKAVGVICVKEGDVLFPYMQGDYQDILASMISKAREVCGPLRASTENEIILSTAEHMGIGVVRTGNKLEFN